MIWVGILFLGLTAAYKKEVETTTLHPDTLIKIRKMECVEVTNAAYEKEVETITLHPDTLIKRYQLECVEVTRVDLNSIARIKSKNWNLPYHQRQLVKEWALCVLMKSGLMTKEGVYKIDVALQRVPLEERDIVESQIDSCLTTKPLPARDIAYWYIKCFEWLNSEYSSSVSAF